MSNSSSDIPRMVKRAAIRKIIEKIQKQDKTLKTHIRINRDKQRKENSVEFIKIADLGIEKIAGIEKIEIADDVINDLTLNGEKSINVINDLTKNPKTNSNIKRIYAVKLSIDGGENITVIIDSEVINDFINNGEVCIKPNCDKNNKDKNNKIIEITKCDDPNSSDCYTVKITPQYCKGHCIGYIGADFFLNLHHLKIDGEVINDFINNKEVEIKYDNYDRKITRCDHSSQPTSCYTVKINPQCAENLTKQGNEGKGNTDNQQCIADLIQKVRNYLLKNKAKNYEVEEQVIKCDSPGKHGCYPVEITLQDYIDYVSEDFFLNLHHLYYELNMLIDLFFILPSPHNQIELNSIIESFRTHLRVFLKFFDKDGYFDEALCRDYVDGLNYILKDGLNYNVKLPEEICDIKKGTSLTPEEVDLLKAKLNLATEHLSYIRSEVDKITREPNYEEVLDAMESICKKMDEFYNKTWQHLELLFIQSKLDTRLSYLYYKELAKRASNLPERPKQLLDNLKQTINRLKSYLCENWEKCCDDPPTL